MIGGTDIHLEVPAESAALDIAIQAIRHFWPESVFQNANSEEPATEFGELDFSTLAVVMAYKDLESAKAWDRLGADPSLNGTMIHLMASTERLTVIVDDEPSAEIKAIVQTITQGLKL